MPGDPYEALQAALGSRYRIERELGRGGMATVYLAHDVKHGRPVALKVLRPEIAGLLGPDRFLREIEFAARLNHPNILPLYDSDQAAGLVFYVMPYVEGGTLRDRLAKGPPPSVAETLGIVRQIAAGLAHAHALEVVHRDIKPANILLSGGHVFIADFGIARAVRRAVAGERLTGTGLVLGTPAYMAPEQVVGSSLVDGRADEYSLACVLYEMLLGEPPSPEVISTGAVRRAIHAARRDVPAAITRALEQALSGSTSRRYPGVAEFAAALEATAAVPASRSLDRLVDRARSIPAGAALVVLVLAALALVARRLVVPASPRRVVVADTSRYAILPFEYQGVTERLDEEELLHDALSRWTGLSLADHFQVGDALARLRTSRLTNEEAATVAAELGAGRYIRGEVSRIGAGDSLRVHATLYDVPSGGTQLSDRTFRLGPGQAGADSLFTSLADELLLRGTSPDLPASSGTRSLPARQAYGRGQRAIQNWELGAADSAFSAATTHDARYADAWLWLALVRAWSGAEPARWRYAAEQAAAYRAGLSTRDQAIADAVLAQGRGQAGQPCANWVELTRIAPRDFAPWFGAAVCLRRDNVVLPDRKSPSGYRFRSSYHAALQAYQRAFVLLPSVLTTLSSGAYAPIRGLLLTDVSQVRGGRLAEPDTLTFIAYPSWEGDTLALVPYSADRIGSLEITGTRAAIAVRHQRQLFHEIALTWTTASPESPQALEALAVSLELLGNRAALDTIARARRIAGDREAGHRIAATEVRMRLKFALPDDVAGLRAAKALADTLLRAHPPADAPEADALLGLAMLTGRAGLAAALSRRVSRIAHWGLPGPLLDVAPALLTFAAIGGPADSLRRLEAQVSRAIDQIQPRSARLALQLEWIARSETLAFPDHRFATLPALAGAGDYLVNAQLAFLRGDSASVRAILRRVQQARRQTPPGDLGLDALFPEAWLLAGLGDDRAAAAWLDPTLNALEEAAPNATPDPAREGGLVRAMALRADLAARMGQPGEARRWAKAVAILWSDADGFLQPLVLRMIGLDGGQ